MSKTARQNGLRVWYISADYTDKDRDHRNRLGWSFEQRTSWHLFVTWHPDYISPLVEQLHRTAVGRRPHMASVASYVVYMTTFRANLWRLLLLLYICANNYL